MPRFFNVAGPCRADLHYMLPPERRLGGIRDLIDQELYFVLHAPRQVGKTTALGALADDLQFVKDLGLVTSGAGGLEITNPIYREVIPRALSCARAGRQTNPHRASVG